MQTLDTIPEVFQILKNSPKELFYQGDVKLLQTPKISIVGTRRPSAYTKDVTLQLAKKFSQIGYTVVSGAAMGVDALAHKGAYPHTIAVMANSLDIVYPKVNEALIKEIYDHGLALSEYARGTRATKYSFVIRNRIVVALGECLIITQADENSGTMRSAEIALELGKKIYVLPHRLGESRGTQKLLQKGQAELILDIDAFVGRFGTPTSEGDPLLVYCQNTPLLSDVLAKFGDKVYEYELEGLVEIKNLKVYLL